MRYTIEDVFPAIIITKPPESENFRNTKKEMRERNKNPPPNQKTRLEQWK